MNSFRGDMWEKDNNGKWKMENPIWEQEDGWKKVDLKATLEKIRKSDTPFV